ncbi:hypothetical protein K1T71_006604 [Dendrolimus kikuchii]|uniref:Uncharacterized protein n=1 Tax=Dendrolimus kikuchii TaxID=765133 RepID=A0ACC1D1K6_9NEOP|nr:hypothetical protein K1T71_006604 [Dendrolimus kikuchii]
MHSNTENNVLIVKDEEDTNTSKVQTNCYCNDTDVNLQKQNCEAVILETSNNISDDTENKNIAIDNNCMENAKGERNQVPVKLNDISSDTILKYVYQKNAKVNEGEKTKGHFKNSLRQKRSPVQNDPRPFAKTKAPLIVNYETSHAPRDVEILEPQQQFFGNNVKNSALADFNIETIHENPQNNKHAGSNNDHLELQQNYQNPDSIKISLNKDYRSNNNERITNKDRESSSSQESVENSRSEENEDSTEKKERQEYNNSKENNSDSGKKDSNKHKKQHDFRSSESTENTKENDESKEFALYKNQDNIDSSEENKNSHKATRLNENEESRENEDYSKELPLKQKTIQTDSSSSESNEDDLKLLNKHNNTDLTNKEEPINKDVHVPIQDVDLDNFSYERIKVNKNGKVEAIKETPDTNSDESNTSAPNNPKTKSENYNEFNSLSEEKSSDSSSSFENNEPTHINDGEIKPVVEINSDVDSIEIIGENSKEKAELNNENESLETLLGVRDKEDIDNNDKLAEQKKTPENGDVKQEFERIPLNYKHDKKMQDENSENITPETKEDKNNAQTQSNNDEKNQGTLDAITPKDEKYDEHLNFKFDDIAIKLPEIKLPDDILDYAYEEPVYDRKQTHEPKKERFYHYKDEDSYEEEPKKDTDDDEDEESDHDYYSRRYGNSDDKQEYKAKKKIEDDEDEDLYEKFVRERFGKKGSFQKRSEKLQIQKDQPNAHLYKTIQNVLHKTKAIEKEAEKSGDPNAKYTWTLEYGQNA